MKTLNRLGGCPGWSASFRCLYSFCWFCYVMTQLYFKFGKFREGLIFTNLRISLNSEIREDLISRNSANAKFRENKTLAKMSEFTIVKINLSPFYSVWILLPGSGKAFGSTSDAFIVHTLKPWWHWLSRIISSSTDITSQFMRLYVKHDSLLFDSTIPYWCRINTKWAATCDFQQCGILTSVDPDQPVQSPFKLRHSKCCSVSSLTVIEYSSD